MIFKKKLCVLYDYVLNQPNNQYKMPYTHPYLRIGTSQNERLLRALMPENIEIDNRKLADLMVFANNFAKGVRFWDETNQPDGDWTCFWQSDALFFLADVAAANTEGVEKRYRQAERRLLDNAKQADKRDGDTQNLINIVFELAENIERWGERAGISPLFARDVATLVQSRLRTRLREAISYDKNLPPDRDYTPFLSDVASSKPFAVLVPMRLCWVVPY